ncbi:MAG: FMN-binding protein [Spirochaetes bacterium]|nr:FMN-binding protein [Spirochaetota bacterium]
MAAVRIFACILLGIVCCVGFAGCEFIKEIEKLTIEDIDVRDVKDGTYEADQSNVPVTAKVQVTVKEGRIIDIELLGHSHGPKHGADEILDRVKAQQSLRVDAVTGATYSSKVVLKAIEKALKQGM